LIDSATQAGTAYFWDIVRAKAALIGTHAPPIVPSFWYPANNATTPLDSGSVTLLYQVSSAAAGGDARDAMLRRLERQYGAVGLRIVLVTQTHGFSEFGAVLSAPQRPEDEARTTHWYYEIHRALPASLAVETTPFTRGPDGRRVESLTPFRSEYKFSPTVVIDRHGIVRCISPMMAPLSEAELSACIARSLVPTHNSTRASAPARLITALTVRAP
jgi:hypothetical protein